MGLVIQAMLVVCLTVLFFRTSRQERKRQLSARWRDEGRCESCGYDLRGSSHAMICPECGKAFKIRKKTPLVIRRSGPVQGKKRST